MIGRRTPRPGPSPQRCQDKLRYIFQVSANFCTTQEGLEADLALSRRSIGVLGTPKCPGSPFPRHEWSQDRSPRAFNLELSRPIKVYFPSFWEFLHYAGGA